MTLPTFVDDTEVTWDSTASSKTTASISCQSGDLLVVAAICEGYDSGASSGMTGELTISSSPSLTWTAQETVQVQDYSWVRIWTATAGTTAGHTVTIAPVSGTGLWYGANVLRYRDSDGFGAVQKTNVASGAPSLAITTGADNSAIATAIGDWSAQDGTVRTWRTVNLITPSSINGYEKTYFRDVNHYAVHIASYPDAGTAGSKTVGQTLPTGQKYAIIALEVKGTAGSDVLMPQICL